MSSISKASEKTLALCRGGAGTKASVLYRMEQADAEKEGGRAMYPGFGPHPPGPPPRGGPWRCVGLCALALGLGMFVAAVFPVGALMFLVAFLLIFCGIGCLRRF